MRYLSFLLAVLLLIGCSSSPAVNVVELESPIDEEASGDVNYQGLAFASIDSSFVQDSAAKDCIDLRGYSVFGKKGDLISSLIVDEDFRAELNLEKYTPDYLRVLSNAALGSFRAVRDDEAANFYAEYLCDVSGVDFVAGFADLEQFTGPGTLIVSHAEGLTVFDQIRITENPETGNEAYHCEASEVSVGSAKWTCFLGENRLQTWELNFLTGEAVELDLVSF